MKKLNFKGFTLVEVLIVIIIVGILIAALIPRLGGGQARARDLSQEQVVGQISTAVELLMTERGAITTTGAICVNSTNFDTSSNFNVDGGTLGGYMDSVPEIQDAQYLTGGAIEGWNGADGCDGFGIVTNDLGTEAVVVAFSESGTAGDAAAGSVTGSSLRGTTGTDLIISRTISN